MGDSKFKQIKNFIIGAFFTFVGLFPFYYLFTSEKHIHSYYLSSWSDNNINRFPMIKVDIDNCYDDCIALPATVSFETAAHMVDSMNVQLLKFNQANAK